MLDTLTLYGTPEEAGQRWRANFEGLYEEPVLYLSDIGIGRSLLRHHLRTTIDSFTAGMQLFAFS
jgi:hypothetical protein